MGERDAPRTTRARTGLALFAAVFGLDTEDAGLRADGGDREDDARVDRGLPEDSRRAGGDDAA